jgi:hypothetical protein
MCKAVYNAEFIRHTKLKSRKTAWLLGGSLVLDEHVLRRLSYAKRIYMHGVEHRENGTQVDLALAILNFDNAIEMLLSVALEFLRGSSEDTFQGILNNFLIEIQKKQLKVKISETGIKNLHLARNKVQHDGIIPCPENLKTYQNLTEQVLAECIKGVFDVEFQDVSLGMLIQNKDLGELYHIAEQKFLSKDFRNSLIYCVATFETAKNLEQDKLYGSGITYRLPKGFEVIVDELEILKLGLDYKKYQKYREISTVLEPRSRFLRYVRPGKITDEIVRVISEKIAPSLDKASKEKLAEHARFCLEFTIESILKWESVPRIPWYEAIGQRSLAEMLK